MPRDHSIASQVGAWEQRKLLKSYHLTLALVLPCDFSCHQSLMHLSYSPSLPLVQLVHGSSYFLIIREDVTGEGDYGEVDPVKKASDTVRWVGPLRWGFGTRPA